MSYLERHQTLLPLLIAASLAAIGAGLMPYDYYVFLPCVLTTTAVFIVVHASRSERLGWLAMAIPMFILWAPAAWIVLPRAVWEVLDVLVAGALVAAGFLIRWSCKFADEGHANHKHWQWWKIALLVYGLGLLAAIITVYAPDRGSFDY